MSQDKYIVTDRSGRHYDFAWVKTPEGALALQHEDALDDRVIMLSYMVITENPVLIQYSIFRYGNEVMSGTSPDYRTALAYCTKTAFFTNGFEEVKK